MTADEILEAIRAGESNDWEFKSAKGGVPASLWETYSAMANTEGGTLVLGVSQKETRFEVSGLLDPSKTRKELWDTLNNPNKVSHNLLTDADLQPVLLNEKTVLVMRVPQATRTQRPVYLNNRVLTDTYRRDYEGDYRCTENEVRRMLADQSPSETADTRILEGFGMGDLDLPTLQQYRQRVANVNPTQVWLGLPDQEFLERLGGWRKERKDKQREGLTVAGLLMFGSERALREPEGVPSYHVDYRQETSEDPEERWVDRLTWNGNWAHNLFQFYFGAITRLTRDLAMPFRTDENLFRKSGTPVHEALQEALVNALIHADYFGQGGIVIVRKKDRFLLSNPGNLLVTRHQLGEGGVSECRNKILQTMFQLLAVGDKAGSGIAKIVRGWDSQKWLSPEIETSLRPDRVKLTLSMVSLMSADALTRLQEQFGLLLDSLTSTEWQVLVIAEAEGRVSNRQMQLTSQAHPVEHTAILQKLVSRGFLEPMGQGRGRWYRLNSLRSEEQSLRNEEQSLRNEEQSLRNEDANSSLSPLVSEKEMERLAADLKTENWTDRVTPEKMRETILRLCRGHYLSLRQLAFLLERNPERLRQVYLTPLVRTGKLELRGSAHMKKEEQGYRTRL